MLTETEVCNLVLEAAGKSEKELPKPRILALRTPALELLSKRVKESADYQGMQKDFSVNPVAGRVDLSAITNILFDLDHARVRVASTNQTLTTVDSHETLESGQLPSDQVYYAQDGRDLVILDGNGSIVAYTTALKIKANFIATLAAADLPDQYSKTWIATIVELLTPAGSEAMETTKAGGA